MRTDGLRITPLRIVLWALLAIAAGRLLLEARESRGADVAALRTEGFECTLGICRKVSNRGSAFPVGTIDGQRIYVTAAHIFPRDVRLVEVTPSGGPTVFPARLLARSERDDVALLGVPGDPTTDCFPVTGREVPPGTAVTVAGFAEGMYAAATGQVIQHHEGHVWIAAPIRPGQSGGPVTDGTGELVGVAVGHDRRNAMRGVAACACRVAVLCRATFGGRLPSCGAPPTTVAPPPPEDPPRLVPVPDPRFAAIEARLAAMEQRTAVPGPAGPQGPPGPVGPQGAAGVVDATALNAIKSRLDRLDAIRIPVQILDESGRVIDSELVPLGGPIKLRGIYRTREKPVANP